MQEMVGMTRSSDKDQFQIEIGKNSKPKCSSILSTNLHYIAYFLGQMPFSILWDSNGEIDRPVVNKLDGAWLVILIGILSYDMYRVFNTIFSDSQPLFWTCATDLN